MRSHNPNKSVSENIRSVTMLERAGLLTTLDAPSYNIAGGGEPDRSSASRSQGFQTSVRVSQFTSTVYRLNSDHVLYRVR